MSFLGLHIESCLNHSLDEGFFQEQVPDPRIGTGAWTWTLSCCC